MAELVVFADDLTGALDTGVVFAGERRAVTVRWRPGPVAGGIAVYDTETRLAQPALAAAELADWVRMTPGLTCSETYMKMDSTLRGPFAAAANALATQLRCRGFVVAAASPGMGRTVVNGHLFVAGIPIERTEFAHDPASPVTGGDIAAIVRTQAGVAAAHLSLDQVRGNRSGLVKHLSSLGGAVVADAEDESDLLAIASAAAEVGGWLLVGSAGLAAAMARLHGWRPPTPVRVEAPQLYVCGSLNPVTREQVRQLCRASGVAALEVQPGAPACGLEQVRTAWEERGFVVLALPEQRLSHRLIAESLQDMAQLAAVAVRQLGLTRLFVTGGSTLLAVAEALALTEFHPQGEVAPGVVFSRVGPAAAGDLEVISKAGGFGVRDLLTGLAGFGRDGIGAQ